MSFGIAPLSHRSFFRLKKKYEQNFDFDSDFSVHASLPGKLDEPGSQSLPRRFPVSSGALSEP